MWCSKKIQGFEFKLELTGLVGKSIKPSSQNSTGDFGGQWCGGSRGNCKKAWLDLSGRVCLDLVKYTQLIPRMMQLWIGGPGWCKFMKQNKHKNESEEQAVRSQTTVISRPSQEVGSLNSLREVTKDPKENSQSLTEETLWGGHLEQLCNPSLIRRNLPWWYFREGGWLRTFPIHST